MQIAVAVADFTPSEADQLRRAMGSKRSQATRSTPCASGSTTAWPPTASPARPPTSIYEKIKAFAAFGFAESHSISFALLVYASSWLKLHYPAAFCAALLNAQPMGFYSPQSLVHDAKRHGVEVPAAVAGPRRWPAPRSRPGATARRSAPCLDAPQPAVRLGLSSVRTIGTDARRRDRRRRATRDGPFTSMADLARRVGLSADQVEALATAGAFDCVRHRPPRRAVGRRAPRPPPGPASSTSPPSTRPRPPQLPAMTEPEQLIADMWATGMTTDVYPTALIRAPPRRARHRHRAPGCATLDDRTRVTVGGVVTHRQRPATARGVTFLNLEDETGMVNVIVDEVGLAAAPAGRPRVRRPADPRHARAHRATA